MEFNSGFKGLREKITFDKMDLLPSYCERVGAHRLSWKQKRGQSSECPVTTRISTDAKLDYQRQSVAKR